MNFKKACFHTLRQNHKLNFKTNEFIFFDTETKEEITEKENDTWLKKELTLKLGWALYWNRLTDYKEWFEIKNNNTKKFWDWVEHFESEKIILFAHNTAFDLRVCDGLNELIIKRKYKEDFFYNEGKSFIMHLSKEHKKIMLWDTSNYVSLPLEKIGKSLKIKKLKINFKNCSDEELSIYCKNDVLIIYELVKQLIDFLIEFDLTKLKPTASGLAFNCFTHKFYKQKKNPILIHAWENAVNLERMSYKGGITDCFKIGTYTEPLHKLDINSMYPHIMVNNDFPTEIIFYSNTKQLDKKELKKLMLKTIKNKKFICIAECKIYLPENKSYIISKQKFNKQEKILFLQGKFSVSLAQPELEYVLKNGKILEVKSLAIYKKRNIFKDYMNFFYSKRLEYKKSKPAFALFCKSMMNNLYGKFAQRETKTVIISENEKPAIRRFKEIDLKNKQHTCIQFGKVIKKILKTEKNSPESFTAISSFVTSHARMYLVKLIEETNRQNIFYTDTDSLIINDFGLQNIKNYLDDNKLGYLKNEGTSTYTKIIAPKYYLFNEETKCKGVRKNKKDEDGNIIERHKIISEDDESLKISQDQFEGFKTAIKMNNLDKIEITNLKKIIKKKYGKGKVINGKVRPYTLEELNVPMS